MIDATEETAGWGTPGWLPPGVARRQAQEDAREALESKRAEAERERRTEERHAAAMELYRAQAEARGEQLDVMAMARGEVRGRSVQDILAAAVAASAAEDRRAEMRAWQQGHGQPERVHVEVAEPVLLAPAARSSIGLRIVNRARRFGEAQRTRAAAEAAAKASANDFGFVCERRPREDDDPVVAVPASRRRGGTSGRATIRFTADGGLRFR